MEMTTGNLSQELEGIVNANQGRIQALEPGHQNYIRNGLIIKV